MLQRTRFDIRVFAPGRFPNPCRDRRHCFGREHGSRDSAGSVENVWLCDVHMSTHLMMLAWGRMRTSMNAEQHGYVHRKKHSVLERPPRATEKSGTLLHPILTVTVSCASGNVGVNVPQEQFPTWPPMPVSSGARHFLMASAGVGSAAHTEAT